MRRPIARIALTAALAFGAATPAAQAETFKTTYGAGTADTFAWAGQATGLVSIPNVIRNGCGNMEPFFRCDLVIFDIKDAGELSAAVKMDDAPTCDPAAGVACDIDIDIYLFKSDAAGTHADDAEPVAESATADQEEKLKVKVSPGFYVLEIEPYQGRDVTYKGTSSYVGPPAPAPAPAAETPAPPPPTQAEAPPQQQQQPAAPSEPANAEPSKPARTGKRAACQKKAKKIKNAKKRKKALKACKRKPR